MKTPQVKIDHYSTEFPSIKVPIYACAAKDCMFFGNSGKTCGLYVPHVTKNKCHSYTPINKENRQ